MHQALRLKAAEGDQTISDLVNEALKRSLAEDADDLEAAKLRRREKAVDFESFVKGMKRRGKL